MQVFNLRVYGLMINELNEVLLSDESYGNVEMTKFPGGGLEWGEGLTDGLIREFIEETGVPVEVGELFYLTDFFQVSAFNKEQQLISVYYLVQPKAGCRWSDYEDLTGLSGQRRYFFPIQELQADSLTFPIDQLVGELLKRNSTPI